jgi:ComF family protein
MSWLTDLERWLLPEECLLCRAFPSDGLICRLCRYRWIRLPEPVCSRCGQPMLLTELACRLCAEWGADLFRVRSAVWHEGGARDAIHQLKYEGWWRVTESLAPAMTRLEPLTGRLVLVPVPLAAKRLRDRGYNQSDHLARALGAVAGKPVWSGALRRIRETPTQTALTPDARLANMAGAFQARGVLGCRVVLVDDVFTTGATLLAAAAALKQAGAAQVEAVTFARAKPSIT